MAGVPWRHAAQVGGLAGIMRWVLGGSATFASVLVGAAGGGKLKFGGWFARRMELLSYAFKTFGKFRALTGAGMFSGYHDFSGRNRDTHWAVQ